MYLRIEYCAAVTFHISLGSAIDTKILKIAANGWTLYFMIGCSKVKPFWNFGVEAHASSLSDALLIGMEADCRVIHCEMQCTRRNLFFLKKTILSVRDFGLDCSEM